MGNNKQSGKTVAGGDGLDSTPAQLTEGEIYQWKKPEDLVDAVVNAFGKAEFLHFGPHGTRDLVVREMDDFIKELDKKYANSNNPDKR